MKVDRTATVQRFLLIDGPRRVAAPQLAAALAAARGEGWTVVRGWAAPLTRERVACTGWIRTADDARRALLAAVAGAGLIVGVSSDQQTLDRLLDDLRRLGHVERVATGDTGPARLTAGQRAVLGLLAEGLTIREATVELGLHRTTAARRLARARHLLRVDRAADEIAATLERRA